MASPRNRNLWILVETQDHISGPPRESAQVQGNGCVGLRAGNGRPGWVREPVRVNPARIHECKRARHHVRRPCEAGVISGKDRANGRRWGRRDENGFIVEVHGFDLAPCPSHRTVVSGGSRSAPLCAPRGSHPPAPCLGGASRGSISDSAVHRQLQKSYLAGPQLPQRLEDQYAFRFARPFLIASDSAPN